jgi:hypothetical protein
MILLKAAGVYPIGLKDCRKLLVLSIRGYIDRCLKATGNCKIKPTKEIVNPSGFCEHVHMATGAFQKPFCDSVT